MGARLGTGQSISADRAWPVRVPAATRRVATAPRLSGPRLEHALIYARSCALAFQPNDVECIAAAIGLILHAGGAAVDGWVQFARRNQVLAVLCANLLRCKPLLSAGPELQAALAAVSEAYRADAAHRAGLLQALQDLAARVDLAPVLAIKGLAMQAAYPRPYQRHLRDLDLFCATPEAAYSLAEKLLQAGYAIGADQPPWVKRLDPKLSQDCGLAAPYFGQINLVRDGGGPTCRFDVHFGLYSIGHTPVPGIDLAGRARSLSWGGLALRAPAAEDCLLIVVAHVRSRGAILVKDLNDVAVLARQPLDWQYIYTEARRVGIDGVLSAVLRWTGRVVPSDPGPRRAAPIVVQSPPPTWRLRWFRRTLLHAYCTYVFERSRFDTSSALANGAACLRYYGWRLEVQIAGRPKWGFVARGDALPVRLAHPGRGQCLRLLPLGLLVPGLSDAAARPLDQGQLWSGVSQWGGRRPTTPGAGSMPPWRSLAPMGSTWYRP